MALNYVTPSKTTPCPNEQRPCLTLKEYASESNIYLVNNTVFCFQPGIHRLGDSLRLKDLYNFSFRGLPTANVEIVHSLASITWEKSWNITVSSITFTLHDNFTFIIRFELSLFVQLSNISILGNGYSGCSSVMSRESTLDVNNSMFSGIKGLLGAALMMLASNITLKGTNIFVNNTALSGGSIYLSDSILTLNGATLFLNNEASSYYSNRTLSMSLYTNYSVDTVQINIGSGGAIFCSTSYLRVYYYGHSNFTGNFAEYSGGAIAVDDGDFFIQGNASFGRNTADEGGAMVLKYASSNIIGNVSLNNNKAYVGGAIAVHGGNLIIQGHTIFEKNSAEGQGGALNVIFTNLKVCGIIYFGYNIAHFSGGVLSIYATKAIFDDKCSTYNTATISFHNSITFFHNKGTSFYCSNSSVEFVETVYFNESEDSAITSQNSNIAFMGTSYFYRNTGYNGGAIQSFYSNIMFSGTVYFDRNKAYYGGAMWLGGTSKLILKPKLNISFILNHAVDSGGALYFRDSQCSLGTTS